MGSLKSAAQAGVLVFVVSNFLCFIPLNALPYIITLPLVLFGATGIFVLLVAALLPPNKDEEWGSIWPLSGYDNAIYAIYARGPWLVRFEELANRTGTREPPWA